MGGCADAFVFTKFKFEEIQHRIYTLMVLLCNTESPRLYRRLQFLRGWSYEQINEILPGDTGTGGADGIRAPGGI